MGDEAEEGTDVEVTDVAERSRYEARSGGELAGFAEYRRRPDRLVFTHTEVRPEHGGRGIGTTLIRAALDSARAQGLGVTPLCPFVAAFIDEHPGYADLVVTPRR